MRFPDPIKAFFRSGVTAINKHDPSRITKCVNGFSKSAAVLSNVGQFLGEVPLKIHLNLVPYKYGYINIKSLVRFNHLIGHVGIGTTSPQQKFEVAGKVRAQGVTQQIINQTWSPANESGTSTSWASLPTDMAVSITTDSSTIWVVANISRVQHSVADTLTEYRVVVDDVEPSACRAAIGDHFGMRYRQMHIDCVTSLTAGNHTVRVQYATRSGIEYWFNNSDGYGSRSIIITEYKN